ncbi:hypothetical protein Droror1_Dr00024052 [Drosera rotundifolia]
MRTIAKQAAANNEECRAESVVDLLESPIAIVAKYDVPSAKPPAVVVVVTRVELGCGMDTDPIPESTVRFNVGSKRGFWELDDDDDDIFGNKKKLVEEGKIKYIRLSETSASTIRRAHVFHLITAVQLEWSLWTRDVEEENVPTCRELRIGIVAYSPLANSPSPATPFLSLPLTNRLSLSLSLRTQIAPTTSHFGPFSSYKLSDDYKRRKKLVPSGLLKANLRPAGGDSRPSDGDQCFCGETEEMWLVWGCVSLHVSDGGGSRGAFDKEGIRRYTKIGFAGNVEPCFIIAATS